MNELSLYLLDIVENSFNANAELVFIDIFENDEYIKIAIIDDGTGIKDINKIFEKGYSTHNSSGVGLYNLKELVDKNNGYIKVNSKDFTQIEIRLNKLNLIPWGNMVDSLFTMLVNENHTIVKFRYVKNGKTFMFDTSYIVSMSNKEIKEYLKSNLDTLN